MDYRHYQTLMQRYKALEHFSVSPQETRAGLIQKLLDVSREKKVILDEANAIIAQYITKYETDPSMLDAEIAAMLDDFLIQLRPPKKGGGLSDPLDPAISLHIAQLLLRYYQTTRDTEQIIRMLQQCAMYDLILKEHENEHAGTPYSLMSEIYQNEIDSLSPATLRTLVHCLTIGSYNRQDLTFGLNHIRDAKEISDAILDAAGEERDGILYFYTLYKANALGFAMYACFLTEDAQNRGIHLSEPLIDLEKETLMIEELRQDLQEILDSDKAAELIYDRISIQIYIAQTDYHLGKITIRQLLDRLAEYAKQREDQPPHEQSSALFNGNLNYLDYLCRCSNFDREYIQKKSLEIIEHVLGKTESAIRKLADLAKYTNVTASNFAILQMLSTASNYLPFAFFKRTVLNATVHANKELYVHTMMVWEISLILLEYIIDNDPQYLDGVAGHNWEYCRDHKQEMLDLMENCALLHDIGKYFCLDIVNNASRSLTDEEYQLILAHPTSFSNIYRGRMDPWIECIRDCAELHHRWYNEAGGYPDRPHTNNKPFVSILTIADCLDAATDNIGRSYGKTKTLQQVIGEFDEGKNTRYSQYIGMILHREEIQRKIQYAITEKRQEIYCEIYLPE